MTPVQDLWERSLKEVGEDNLEQTVTGMLIFYPYQLAGYLEVNLHFHRRYDITITARGRGVSHIKGLCVWKYAMKCTLPYFNNWK